ncbi:MAG: DUF3848 domain-containing protein [Clostridia bacterium]|nr:DUF3848 domain-containing protein [Clostridia bacterium]
MDKREMLIRKTENEYENFIDNLKQCSFDVILENADMITNMKLIKDYISKGHIVHGEDVDFLLSIDKPLQTIYESFEQSTEDIINALEEAVSEARYYGETVEQPPEYIQKLTEKILSGITNVSDFISPQGEIKDAELFELVSVMSSIITKEDAMFLMQFKKPLDVMSDLVPYNDSDKNNIYIALEKMRNSDIYTMPYSLDSDSVLPEAKFRHNAINNINNIVPKPDFNTTANWLKLCREIFLEDAESAEINPYVSLVDAMYYASEQHGSEILQKLYDMGEEKCITPMEIKGAAAYLANGGNIKRVPSLAQEGYFEEIHPNNTESISDSEDEEMEM